ncbi:alanine dehydrogenase [Kallipyga gabonensis]|uniref:alanine dehydrogenase n=1 Tax=Kallipyga gabonensis TaxID=1686287 RepID=UPI0006B50A24|nr:alanine dehydrogenase [Kallipyga gabonensis]
MKVGCVREIKNNEFRVGLTPDGARDFIAHGHEVFLEKNAGFGSGFPDEDYRVLGVTILDQAEEVWNTVDLMIKVKEPLKEEYTFLREGMILFTYFHLAAAPDQLRALLNHKIKAVAYETIEDEDGSLPCLAPMSQIAGRLSIQEGAKYLEKPFGGAGILLAGVPGTPKANVVILGAGAVGTNACKIALGMGANVSILNRSVKKLEYLDNIFGAHVQTLVSSDSNIERVLKNADLVIGSVLVPGGSTPKLIRRHHLKMMKNGAVFVDVSIDQGGCAESSRPTTHDDPIYIEEGVIHYCVTNMPGAVPRTSTIALTNATLKYALKIADMGLEKAAEEDMALAKGVNCYLGELTNKNVAEATHQEYLPLKQAIHA